MSEDLTRAPRPGPGPAADEPVAVVGMACRFPGADRLDGFWRLLVRGGDAIGPAEGWRSGRRAGGYLRDVDRFDAQLFGMPAAEAAATDPQQRLLLELCWHALEDARTAPDALAGSPVGVFTGSCADDYALLSRAAGVAGAYTMTGIGRAFLANRLSHAFGFTGPSLVVDTGQSSSLAALHQAVQALRRGECSAAVVAAAQLNLAAEGDEVVQALGALSPTGRCHTFDSRADGIVRGEGAGVLVLKPLGAAQADGDRIYCVVLGSAVNNDGGATALTAPSARAQQAVLSAACRQAGVAPADVSYVELHGTGTPLGDPVEAAALGAVHGRARPPGAPLLVGSVKTNIGHLEGAAGIAGFIKTALGLHHRALPPSVGFREPNPAIDLDALRLEVCHELREWPGGHDRLLAGVSSFGLGGTNCHVLLGEAPGHEQPRPQVPAGASAVPVVLSGRTPAAMRQQAARLADALDVTRDSARPALADIGLSSATTRAALPARGAVVASGPDELVVRLRQLADGEAGEAQGVVERTGSGGLAAFLFPGQGMQRLGMGQRLHKEFGAFARAFDAACAALEPVVKVSLPDVMWGRNDLVDRLDYAQPALFAVEVALYRLFESWGLVPDVLVGHSQGEITAVHLAGALSLEDAAVLVARRGQLIDGLPPGGAMVAVQAEEGEALAVLARESGAAGIAAVNSPRSLVVSGEQEAVHRVAAHFEALGRRTRRLRIAAAGHSPLMAPIREELRAVAEGLTWRPATGPVIVSTVTGRPAAPEEFADPGYWPDHLCSTVRFASAVRTAHGLGARLFVEPGPGQGLSTMAAETVAQGEELFVAPLATEQEVAGAAEVAAGAFVMGRRVDWPAVHGRTARRADLPLYPFQRERYWLDTAAAPEAGEGPGPVAAEASADPFELVVGYTLRTLGLEPAAELDLSRSFNDLGFDSRMAVGLRTALTRATGRPMPTTLLFDHPTPAALIEALETDTPL